MNNRIKSYFDTGDPAKQEASNSSSASYSLPSLVRSWVAEVRKAITNSPSLEEVDRLIKAGEEAIRKMNEEMESICAECHLLQEKHPERVDEYKQTHCAKAQILLIQSIVPSMILDTLFTYKRLLAEEKSKGN